MNGKEFITISNDFGLIYKFEILTVDKNKLKLKRID